MFKVKIDGLEEMIANFEQCQRELEREMIYVFFQSAYEWIVSKANMYIDQTDIGANTKEQIKIGWQPPKIAKSADRYRLEITNTDDSAVFIEFGVGIEGKKMPHTNAKNANPEYRYNIGTKIRGNVWMFPQEDEQEIDIAKKYYWKSKKKEGSYLTRGQPATMYLYKSATEFVLVAPRIWKETRKMFWR